MEMASILPLAIGLLQCLNIQVSFSILQQFRRLIRRHQQFLIAAQALVCSRSL